MATPSPGLPEKDFISEGYKKNPLPFWLWLFLLTAFVAILWGIGNWYTGKINFLQRASPFLQVTNRQMSLFLWQNPEFMRVNVKQKEGYLPAFQVDKVVVDPANADQYAVAPPELLFRYHTWNRLVSNEFTETPIPRQEFAEFLDYDQEWRPMYWLAAPEGYVHLIKGLPTSTVEDLSTLSQEEMPMEVRMAFQGWKNYFKQGEAINALEVSVGQMLQFLKGHPHYARNYWRNIVEDKFPSYLMAVSNGKVDEGASVPKEQITSFLRVALFNYFKGAGKTSNL